MPQLTVYRNKNPKSKADFVLMGLPTMILRTSTLSILALCGLAILACGSGSGPGSVVEAYQEAIQDGDYEAAYGYVSSQDRAVRSQQEFVDNTREAMVLFGGLMDQTSYEITGEEVEGDRATVAVTVTRPAIESLVGELMAEALSSAFSDEEESEEALQEALHEKLEAGDLPMTTDQETFDLVREEDGWKIVFGWHLED